MSKIAIDFKTGLLKSDEKVIAGIDLGTTNSLIAYISKGNPEIIRDSNNNKLFVPSIIHVNDQGEIIIGHEAKNKLEYSPNATVYSIKRLIGKSFSEASNQNINQLSYSIEESPSNDNIRIKIKDRYYTPIELSSFILLHLKNQAQQSLKVKIEQVVITVPAYFNDEQRQATRDAGKLAGLDVLRIINEPTAASLAYGIGLNRQDSKTIVVYDFGGGTFDVSVLRIEDGIFDVLATRGDTYLGGDDIDYLISDYWIKENALVIDSIEKKIRLKNLAENAKISVSNEIPFISRFENYDLTLTLDSLKEIIKPIIQRTLTACQHALSDSKLDIPQIDEILLVGGSTRIPLIKSALQEFFSKEINDSLHPDEAVALGAAIQADILAGNRSDFLLLDVNPLSLGIETLGGLMDIIIPRNSKIPVQLAREYTTSKDGQVNLKIAVYQGERDLVAYNKLLGEFILKGIPPMPAGIPKIQVIFSIDANGILSVKAKELRTNTEQEIIIKSQLNISVEEISRMLNDSLHFAKSDMENKSLIDTINEANNLLLSTTKFLSSNSQYLKPQEILNINNLHDQLNKAVQTKDKNIILEKIDILNEYTTPLAHESLDRNIKKALTDPQIITNINKEI